MTAAIPVIDLFAGPGGLGEGFSAVRHGPSRESAFQIKVSIEKDPIAHKTLRLRAIFRHLRAAGVADRYYRYIKAESTLDEITADNVGRDAQALACTEAICAELGRVDPNEIDRLIASSLRQSNEWILIGGPPCQAYSLVGRARRRNDPAFPDDEKHFLYKEYLRIISAHTPSVFVMENVKGLLSSQHQGTSIFQRILEDLSNPRQGLFYEIRSLVVTDMGLGLASRDFVIESERFGVPQRRHRVILLGVLRPGAKATRTLEPSAQTPLSEVLDSMPRIRSKLSDGDDDFSAWKDVVEATLKQLKGWRSPVRPGIESLMSRAIERGFPRATGDTYIRTRNGHDHVGSELSRWLHDPKLDGVVQHQARSHMAADVQRYFFASCFAKLAGVSPKLRDFPDQLLPQHENVRNEIVPFEDRFRVQLRSAPATTIVSHIAKDGHYYIHPDPSQCRSLSVREAARLQTFPDNYFFEGNRTQQYAQVGNAVPPFLARQIGSAVATYLGRKESA